MDCGYILLMYRIIVFSEPLHKTNHLSRKVSINPWRILHFGWVLSRAKQRSSVFSYGWSEVSSPSIVWVMTQWLAASQAPEGAGIDLCFVRLASVGVVFFFFCVGVWACFFLAWGLVVVDGVRSPEPLSLCAVTLNLWTWLWVHCLWSLILNLWLCTSHQGPTWNLNRYSHEPVKPKHTS
jgi:hypothetical protein